MKSNAYPVIKKKAMIAFSRYIRTKHADTDGLVECYTCGVKRHWKDQMHAGHYHHSRLDFDERNRRPQCSGCNTYRDGKLDYFSERLTLEYGVEGMAQLRFEANQNQKYDKEWLKEMTKFWNDFADKGGDKK
jgi:hypothetical protein